MSDSAYASLGPTLLARKGGAKPAMRPQLPVAGDAGQVPALADEQLDDLGWNDMGDDASAAAGEAGVVVPIDPDSPFDAAAGSASPAHNPIVRRQQRRLEERLLADAVMTGPEDAFDDSDADHAEEAEADWDGEDDADTSAAAAYAPLHSGEQDCDTAPIAAPVLAVRARPAAKPAAHPAPAIAGRRAAFTLRLDPERHLKLRLAATMRGVSAQALVTDALDALLAEYAELDQLAARLQRH